MDKTIKHKEFLQRIEPKQGETDEDYLERVAPEFMKIQKEKRKRILENKTMIEVLQSLCNKTGWYKIEGIVERFRAKMHPQPFNNYKIREILDNIGFSTKRWRGNCCYVFIAHEALIQRVSHITD